MSNQPTILFVCQHNAGRSAMAAALARQKATGKANIISAGTAPSDKPSPNTIATLAELGIDDSDHIPQPLTDELVSSADIVVAMKPGLSIPQIDGVEYVTWSFPDPANWDIDGIRPLRNDIKAQVDKLLDSVISASPAGPE